MTGPASLGGETPCRPRSSVRFCCRLIRRQRRSLGGSARSCFPRRLANSPLAVFSVALLLLLFGGMGCRSEATFPDQPITLVCPWSAGGGTDRVSRQMAAELEAELGVPVNVVNATGGGGVTGHTRGARARADGYTLTTITVELSMLHWRGLTNLTHRDFAPVQLLNRDAAALFVRGDSPYQTPDDLQAAVEATVGSAAGSRGKLKASGTAYGGIWHIATAGWLDHRGLAADAVTWVSINGAGPSIQELLAGGVDFICCSLPEADAVVAGGQVRCLGVMAEERVKGFEQVPTFQEQGHAWSLAGWRGLALPHGTPPERVEVIRAAVERVTAGESFQQFMASSGFDMSLEGPERFGETLEHQDRLFGGILSQEAFSAVSGEHFGPWMFPIAIGIVLPVVLGLVIRESLGQAKVARGEFPRGWTLRAAAMLVGIVFYHLVSEPLGYVLTAALLLIGTQLVLGVPRRLVVPLAIVLALVTYQLFGVMLRVPLPRGFLEW